MVARLPHAASSFDAVLAARAEADTQWALPRAALSTGSAAALVALATKAEPAEATENDNLLHERYSAFYGSDV